MKNRNNGGGGSGGGGSNTGGRKTWKEKLVKNRPKVYDSDPTCTLYCSLCGVQTDHNNRNCPLKAINKYWKAGITFDNRCVGF